MATSCTPTAFAQVTIHPLCADRALQAKAEPPTETGVCQIIDTRKPAGDGQIVLERDAIAFLARMAAQADIVILGEVHDNAGHHRLRGAIIERLARHREAADLPKPAVTMEHLRTDQQPALDRFAELQRDAEGKGTAEDLLAFLEWDQTGWPPQAIFLSLFKDMLGMRLAILPGDAPREEIRKVARQGMAALDDTTRQRLKLADPLPKPLADALATEIKVSHCGLMPEAALAPMAVAQRYRDAHLADAVVRAADKAGAAVLLTGNGHVRSDRAVPYYIRQMAPKRSLLSVMFLEVEAEKTAAADYVQHSPDGAATADIVVVTTRAEREDPCEALRKRMARPGKAAAPDAPPASAKPAETPAPTRPAP